MRNNTSNDVRDKRIKFLESQLKKKDEEIALLKISLEIRKSDSGELESMKKASELTDVMMKASVVYRDAFKEIEELRGKYTEAIRNVKLLETKMEKKYDTQIGKSIKKATKNIIR